jgi:hypothetical protein
MDLRKVKALLKWERQINMKEIHSLLWLGRYYKRFMEGYSTITSSLIRLT